VFVRTFLTLENLKRAAGVGFVVSAMAVPRVLEAGRSQGSIFLLIALFPVMIVVAGAATAWGGAAGMYGLFPERRRLLWGVGIAFAAGIAALPLLLRSEAGFREALGDGDPAACGLAFPVSLGACFALMLWSAGFETMFLQAGTMSFVGRVTGSLPAAMVCAVATAVMIMFLKVSGSGVDTMMAARLARTGLTCLIACLLYARAGLPAAMVFNAVIESRHMLRLLYD